MWKAEDLVDGFLFKQGAVVDKEVFEVLFEQESLEITDDKEKDLEVKVNWLVEILNSLSQIMNCHPTGTMV